MNKEAKIENARTLAAALGIDEEKALELLSVTVALTYDASEDTSLLLADHILTMVSRTIEHVVVNGRGASQNITVELVIGQAKPLFKTSHLFAAVGLNEVLIGRIPFSPVVPSIHPVGILLGACYAVGAILKKALNELLTFPSPETFRINLKELLGDDLPLLNKPVFFDEAYLAGAGAIGNGFIYGLSQFKIIGLLHVVDDDSVSNGNLQRCIYFTDKHVGLAKADILSEAITKLLPEVKTVPYKMRLQDVPAKKEGAWLKRLIVGVDSPRARRSLQSEVPQEVFDASTTGITEVVLHFNRQPTEFACMGCIYHENPEEHAHEEHVAEALGVSMSDMKLERISAEAAKMIHLRYPQVPISELEGLAYDTLFKRLCSTDKLMSADGRQVLAPFAFVSVLAGTLLAIEFVRRIHNRADNLFNEWHASPWTNPVMQCRHISGSNPKCEFCGNEVISKLQRGLWQPS